MGKYFQFLAIGLILGLFTEFQLKLVARINPPAMIIAIVVYPFLIIIAYAISKLIDHHIAKRWTGDILHYLISGIGGLVIEWTLLGNDPSSNALQFGMFAMWTTFCFGPRILTRGSALCKKDRRSFWFAFAIVAVLITLCLTVIPDRNAKIVIAVWSLSITYAVWSFWLLLLAWKNHSSN